ncbi:Uma2 family endonuclease [Phormidesmis priestleyi ULC007]|uniref:Uma2 family endonuclease n=1 Tax=Phormidesmis priestleyi ULC007 TaxID=1920490 RepID=A0A2T1DDZ7_9CYAN|nr:Uma2 family endonuclease [Phormidesmis priestleyi]PSB18684.1 Uma2 family endonuclease [Phormidesmis priestleyi ULC007]PZO51555.1 MAG: Uma2 family endonuclease [Phormidesmis priestleyi]
MVSTAPLETQRTLSGEKRVTLHGLNWQAYQQILHALPQTRAARLTYDRGTLEITMPSENHEFFLHLIELFVRILVVESGMKIKTMGSTTLDREDLNRGSEPDCAYYIQNQPKVAGRNVDLAQDPPPDLLVEVDITHTDIDKNRLYAAMGVPEFWRYNGREWLIYQLQGESYTEVDRSPTFTWVEKTELYCFLEQAQQDEVQAEIDFRARVKELRKQL